jgi:acyl carrier protein
MEGLVEKLKIEIIDVLKLEDLDPEKLDKDKFLFGEELGLDSIDVLELVALLEKNYGIKIEDPNKEGKKIFYSVQTIADYIVSREQL